VCSLEIELPYPKTWNPPSNSELLQPLDVLFVVEFKAPVKIQFSTSVSLFERFAIKVWFNITLLAQKQFYLPTSIKSTEHGENSIVKSLIPNVPKIMLSLLLEALVEAFEMFAIEAPDEFEAF